MVGFYLFIYLFINLINLFIYLLIFFSLVLDYGCLRCIQIYLEIPTENHLVVDPPGAQTGVKSSLLISVNYLLFK